MPCFLDAVLWHVTCAQDTILATYEYLVEASLLLPALSGELNRTLDGLAAELSSFSVDATFAVLGVDASEAAACMFRCDWSSTSTG